MGQCALTAVGLAVIGLTATAEGPQRSSLAALIAVETAILALGVGLGEDLTRRDIEHRREALLLAIAAGVLFGVSDVAIKYLTHATRAGVGPAQPVDADRADLVRGLLLRVRAQPADRPRDRGDCDHLGGRQPLRDRGRRSLSSASRSARVPSGSSAVCSRSAS